MSSHDRDLGWMLENMLTKAPGGRHALVLSKDGLKVCYTPGLSVDAADQLSAIAAGIQSLALSASGEFGEGLGAGQSMVEFRGGVLLIVPAGEGAHLAVVTTEDAEVGLVAHFMNELVDQIGDHLTAPPRRPQAAPQPPDGARPPSGTS
ncbi:roadblock/LC7 domain-containing protein [Actinomadura parmotrematis]|uniref:Roadblock/LC7 domain-containing protein n=1 Tax=Actinomadura parmotrematis TaxID=2864039 RepID=A0ABS7G1P3_9ACTN|nr:roadblock/LC7 domain-containing protein [Actinomadura parmotrematis]MBW8486629.1 roadblock/LC7 domain-containing protein [Actinomadura parmotrematis]